MRFEVYFRERGDKQIVKSFVIVSNLGCIFYGWGGMSVFLRDVFLGLFLSVFDGFINGF